MMKTFCNFKFIFEEDETPSSVCKLSCFMGPNVTMPPGKAVKVFKLINNDKRRDILIVGFVCGGIVGGE